MFEEILAALIFLILTVASFYAVLSKRLLRAVLAFAASMLSLGIFYILLNQTFLGLIHIFIYVGGVAVLAAFAYMTSISVVEVEESHSPFKIEGTVLAILLGIGVFFAGYKLINLDARAELTEVSVYEIGRSLLKDRLLEFELVSVLLVVALIASLAIIRGRNSND